MEAAPERPMKRTSSAYIAESAQGTHSFKVAMKRVAGGAGAYMSSDIFAIGGYDWRIRCYPRGSSTGGKNYVAVLLDLLTEGIEVQVIYDFRLLDRATGEFTSVSSEKELSTPSRGPWGDSCFIKRSALGASSSYLHDDGCIVIECDVTVVKQSLVAEMAVEVQVPPSDMLDDLGKLLESEEGADVMFEVKGEVFHAHEVVLAARSPVLKEILRGLARDNDEMKSVMIGDVEPDVFKALLRFIYRDSLPAMDDDADGGETNEEMLWCLLVAAEKYGMERMKLVCIDILCKRFDDKSVVGTLALADKHRCTEVRDACVEFMKRECPAVYIDLWEKAARSPKI
ncbi:unnamed protein product [Urochloa decumbens]|uniref:Uncharacterized protein n=1 Tax=Urochloa decumbens TaxID=240449 RepID=A0ABC9C4X8_9POAL